MPCLAAVETIYTGDTFRIGWIHEPSDLWLTRMEGITPHMVIEFAKVYVHNPADGFAREPIQMIVRRVMTFAMNDPDAPIAREQLRIRPNNGRTPLDISCCQVALSATQTTELLDDMDPAFFENDDLHETPAQRQEKDNDFIT